MPTGPILPKCLPRKEAGKCVPLCWDCAGFRKVRAKTWQQPGDWQVCCECGAFTARRVRTEDLNERGATK